MPVSDIPANLKELVIQKIEKCSRPLDPLPEKLAFIDIGDCPCLSKVEGLPTSLEAIVISYHGLIRPIRSLTLALEHVRHLQSFYINARISGRLTLPSSLKFLTIGPLFSQDCHQLNTGTYSGIDYKEGEGAKNGGKRGPMEDPAPHLAACPAKTERSR